MSDVLFRTADEVAVLAAAERARTATMVDDLALGLLAPHRPAAARWLSRLLRPEHFLRTVAVDDPRWAEEYRAAFAGHVDAGLVWADGRSVESFALALNTAVLVGNDCLRLLVWLHAECEHHGYIEPAHQDWAAGIIEEGLSTGLLRAAAGWPGVVALLRARHGPVVLGEAGDGMSAAEAADAPEAPWNRPGATAPAPQEPPGRAGSDWADVLARLRVDPALLPLDPQTIRRPYGHGLTVLDLTAQDSARRLARVAVAA
jgi:hypothetical protein